MMGKLRWRNRMRAGSNENPYYMNNIAYAHGMKPLLYHSYYVGTFGTYDLDAIRRSL